MQCIESDQYKFEMYVIVNRNSIIEREECRGQYFNALKDNCLA